MSLDNNEDGDDGKEKPRKREKESKSVCVWVGGWGNDREYLKKISMRE